MPSLTTAVISVTTLIASPSLSTGGFFSLRIECLRNDNARTGRTQKSPRGAGNKKAAWRRLWFFLGELALWLHSNTARLLPHWIDRKDI